MMFLLGVMGLMVACWWVQDIATPVPSSQMVQVSGEPYPKLKKGHGVYMRQCAQCHEHRIPFSATFSEWHDKVSAMSMRAAISKEEERFVNLSGRVFRSLESLRGR